MPRLGHAALAAMVVAGAGVVCAAPAAAGSLTVSDPASPMAGTARIVLDESSSGPAEARVGDHVEVRLKAQFGTGFSWALSGSPLPALAPTAETIEPVEAPQPPEGGFETQVFSFDAVAPGEARLDFVYRRPWIPDDPTNRHVVFIVTVTAR